MRLQHAVIPQADMPCNGLRGSVLLVYPRDHRQSRISDRRLTVRGERQLGGVTASPVAPVKEVVEIPEPRATLSTGPSSWARDPAQCRSTPPAGTSWNAASPTAMPRPPRTPT